MQDYEKPGVFYLGREIDPAGAAPSDRPLLYESAHLTTHAVCVGMTGSGKTGLCISLLEEAAIDGIPALCIDPKGDLGNLMLAFPGLAPSDFVSWVDPAEAQLKNLPLDQFAAQTAQTWKSGLEEWGQSAERVARFKRAAELSIYTPGSESGLALSVLRSFVAPPTEALQDTTALRDRIGTLAAGLLSLIGRDIDPVKSRDHILLSNIIEHAWRAGTSLDMAGLIGAVRAPAFQTLGALDLETFYPAKERLELAMALNNLLASPGFSAWLSGEPLDVQRLLYTNEGKPRLAIISIAHLSDAERMFIVTLILNEMVAWMRTQPGTDSLRAIFYMDEIFGFFPPSANPASKVPMLTLLKQARAFGLGCVLATQNPVDLDYKGLSNAGTWFIGRLQTERDRMRVLDGLDTALATAGSERAAVEKLVAALPKRTFVLRDAHESAPRLFKTRWALSYLRGPLTGQEIGRLMATQKSERRRGVDAPARTATAVADNAFPRPQLGADVREYFLRATPGTEPITYRPMIMGSSKLHFVDAKLGIDTWQTTSWLAPLSEEGERVLWEEAHAPANLATHLGRAPEDGASFAPLPPAAMRAASYAEWGKALARHLYEGQRFEVLVADSLKQVSSPTESESEFRTRLAQQARTRRDAEIAELRARYTPKLATLEDRERRAQERGERERGQLSQQKVSTALAVGTSILGALLGRKRVSASTIGRVATAARSAGRIGREQGDVEHADENLEAVRQRRRELQAKLDAEAAELERRFDAGTVELRKAQVSARKSDVAIGEVALVWAPWRKGSDGFPAPAWPS